MTDELRVSFGLRKNGSVVHVTELDATTQRGLDCECSCAECGDRLVARLGDVRQHHFAHHTVQDCVRSDESALHKFAKEVFLRHESFVVPELIEHCGWETAKVSDAAQVAYVAVAIEQKMPTVTPDVVLKCAVGPPMLVEIGVTHFVDEEKCGKLRNIGYPCIEVDLGDLMTPEEFDRAAVEEALITGVARKEWVYHPEGEVIRAAMEEAARKKVEERERHEREAEARQERIRIERARVTADEYQQQMAVKTEGELPTHPLWVANRRALGIPEGAATPWYINFGMPGEYLFTVHRTVWQSALFRSWVYNKRLDERSTFVSVKFAVEQLHDNHPEIWERCLYWAWKDDPRALAPSDVVGQYLRLLEHCGFLRGAANRGSPYHWTFNCVRPEFILLPPEFNSPRYLPLSRGAYDTEERREITFQG